MRLSRKRILIGLVPALLIVIAAGCWIKIIDTPYYTQETSYWCGAASAQMVLESENIGTYVAQSVLYGYINPRNVCPGWASGPQALADALNNWYPAGHFYVSAQTDQDEGLKKVAYTIDRYGVPPISLIYGCGHWVVMTGVYTDVQPTTASTYTIHGFWVNDPWYGTTSLGEMKYVEAPTWKSSYFTGCNWCARTGTRYISVVDPDPPPRVAIRFPEVMPRRDVILEPGEILELANRYRGDFERNAARDEKFERMMASLEGTEMVDPMLVRRSDRERDAYYIVPLNRGELTAGAVLIDAYSGQLQEATYAPEPIRYLPDLEREAALHLFQRKLPRLEVAPDTLRELRIEPTVGTRMQPIEPMRPVLRRAPVLPSVRPLEVYRAPHEIKTFDRVKIAARDVEITRTELVWEPSAESQNPYYPLWSVSGRVKDTPETVLGYVTAAGDVRSRLTPVEELKGAGSR